MENKEELKEKMKKMASAKCGYPTCNKKQMMTCSLSIVAMMPSGQLITPYKGKDSETSIGVPFCAYHFRLAAAGLLCVLQKRNKHYVHGPFDLIKVAEAVLDAKNFSKDMIENPGDSHGP